MVGQVARDVVLVVDELPAAGGSARVRTRRELLGGKGANQAVALAQLGAATALVGVIGDDAAADGLLGQLRADQVDAGHVVRRPGCATGMVVELVNSGEPRYLEDLPEQMLLTEADVLAAEAVLRAAACTVVPMRQPAPATLAAARLAKAGGRMVVLDGAPQDRAILGSADVLRAGTTEAELLTGRKLDTTAAAVDAGRLLLATHRGLRLVVFAVGEAGNVFIWDGGHQAIPLVPTPVVDATGSGDAFVAALALSLLRGRDFRTAARLAVAAAAATVGHPGGRPRLTSRHLAEFVIRVNQLTGP